MNRGQGRALMAALSAASRNMDKGDTEAEDFVKTGVMEETEGTELINGLLLKYEDCGNFSRIKPYTR